VDKELPEKMIDIYKICPNKRAFITSILEDELAVLKDIFTIYYNKTGYMLYEYGDLSIKNNALNILLSILKADLSKDETIKKYYDIIYNIYTTGCDILFVGD